MEWIAPGCAYWRREVLLPISISVSIALPRLSTIGLAEFREGAEVRTAAKTFPGGPGRWEIRRSLFREQGLPHKLLVTTDLSRTLREEERQAWKRLAWSFKTTRAFRPASV